MKKNKLSVYTINNVKDPSLPTLVYNVILQGKLSSKQEGKITKNYTKFWNEHESFGNKKFWKFLERPFKKYDCKIVDLDPHYSEIYLYGYTK